VGANIGIQLHGMRRYVGKDARLSAVEPNPLGCKALRQSTALGLHAVLQADARSIPLLSDSMDLVYTRGVLIHIEPDHLPVVMREITRVSRRFVLCLEYFSHKLTEVHYRGMSSRLWKQDFGRRYLENCPDLKVHSYGFIWQVEFPHNDDLNWWLFEKKGQDSK
jgi:pseudaminic acid biosynthesis-associated methylase